MADIWYDVDTALAEVPINLLPLLDDTDFKSKEESVTYNQAGLDLVWNFVTTGGALTQTAVTPTDTGGNYDFVNQGNGHYTIEIPASGGASINNDTEGFGWFTGVATGILPWRSPIFGFRASGLNDKLIDSAYSATRGLAGTALPDAAADAAGGLPISDAGGLDLDTQIGTDIDAILADTGTDGVLIADTQGAVTWGQQKIVADVNQEGALEIINENVNGLGEKISGGDIGLSIYGGNYGQSTYGDLYGWDIEGGTHDGMKITGGANGATITATGEAGVGLKIDADVPTDPAIALEASITEIKGAGWTDENLTTIDANIDAILADTGTDGVVLANDAITAAKIATDAIDADALKADAITEIQNGLATPTNITAGTITTVTNLTNLPTMPADWITASGLKADAVAEIASAILAAVADGTLTVQDSIKVWNAALFGKLDGGGTGTLKFRNPADTLDRITATVDLTTGDRDAITLNLT